MRAASTPLFSSAALTAVVARSANGTSLSEPPKVPMAVRMAERTNTSWVTIMFPLPNQFGPSIQAKSMYCLNHPVDHT